jgi:hypothetical protein
VLYLVLRSASASTSVTWAFAPQASFFLALANAAAMSVPNVHWQSTMATTRNAFGALRARGTCPGLMPLMVRTMIAELRAAANGVLVESGWQL